MVPQWISFAFAALGTLFFAYCVGCDRIKTKAFAFHGDLISPMFWTIVFSLGLVFVTRTDEGKRFVGRVDISHLEVIDVQVKKFDDFHEHALEIVNTSLTPITLVSSVSSCNCTSTVELPMKINPGVTRLVPIRVKKRSNSTYSEVLAYFTECPEQIALKVKVDGQFS